MNNNKSFSEMILIFQWEFFERGKNYSLTEKIAEGNDSTQKIHNDK
jgi:hypothetical protein